MTKPTSPARRIGLVAMGLAILGLAALALVATAGLLSPASAVTPAAKRLETAAAGDCQACHGERKVLPTGHEPTKALAGRDCAKCHAEKGRSLRTKLPLGHGHHLAGLGCADCHGQEKPAQALPPEKCLECHGPAPELAQKTAQLKENPHDSPHYGPENACDLCHKAHAKSENFCAQCHEWKLNVP